MIFITWAVITFLILVCGLWKASGKTDSTTYNAFFGSNISEKENTVIEATILAIIWPLILLSLPILLPAYLFYLLFKLIYMLFLKIRKTNTDGKS